MMTDSVPVAEENRELRFLVRMKLINYFLRGKRLLYYAKNKKLCDDTHTTI